MVFWLGDVLHVLKTQRTIVLISMMALAILALISFSLPDVGFKMTNDIAGMRLIGKKLFSESPLPQLAAKERSEPCRQSRVFAYSDLDAARQGLTSYLASLKVEAKQIEAAPEQVAWVASSRAVFVAGVWRTTSRNKLSILEICGRNNY